MTNSAAYEQHGFQPKTYVCDYIVQSLRDRQPRGLSRSAADGDQQYPDAWCTECNDRLRSADGEWTDESEKAAKVRLLCARCYEAVKALNGL